MKHLVKTIFPWLIPIIRNLRGKLSYDEIKQHVLSSGSARVMSGPFRAMKYIDQSNGSALLPKLLGTYERELHPVVETISRTQYVTVIDVGCAEGYYAVGLALRLPGVTVEAYDIDPCARSNLKQLADLNDVSAQIVIGAECSDESVQALASQHCLFICDIEGGERDLLDLHKRPALADFDILVEIHDGKTSAIIHDLLVTRFCHTHTLQFIRYEGRTAKDANVVTGIWRERCRMLAVDEGRQLGLEWGWFRAHRWLKGVSGADVVGGK